MLIRSKPNESPRFAVISSALFGCPVLSEPQQEKGKTSMLLRFEPQPERLRRFLAGPLGPHIESFATLLSRQGYRPAVAWRKIWLVAELSRWLERRLVALKNLEERHIAAFLQARWQRVSKRCGEATRSEERRVGKAGRARWWIGS